MQSSDGIIASFLKKLLSLENSQDEEPPGKPEEEQLLNKTQRFFNTTIREIMVPRTKMETISHNKTIEDAIQLINETGHSRIPVHENNRDKIVGLLYAKDLFQYFHTSEKILVSDVMRKPYYVSFSQHIHDLLTEFKKLRIHLAIVIDEYGGVAGLVTVEDVIEELVGDIQDEFDFQNTPSFNKIENGVFLLDADYFLEDFNEQFGADFQKDGFETIGGYLCNKLGEIPQQGEVIDIGEVKFVIEERDERKITKLKVTFPVDNPV